MKAVVGRDCKSSRMKLEFKNLQVYQRAVDFADAATAMSKALSRGFYFLVDPLNCNNDCRCRQSKDNKDRIMNLFEAFQLIPALQMIFSTEIEFVEDSFRELTVEQYEIFRRKHGQEKERIFEIVPIERTAIERTDEKVTFELSIVMDSERKLLLQGVKFIYHCTKSDGFPADASFQDRLEYLRTKLPPEMLSMPEA